MEKLWRWVRRHPVPAGLLAAGLLAPVVALIALSLLSARLVRSNALESAAQQAELLEEATKEYSRNVQRVEKANYPVNKTVPPTPGTVPLSIPATFLHDVGEQLGQTSRTGVKVRQYSDYPFPWRTDGGPRDEFEREALRRLRQSKGQETVHEFTEIGGQRVVRYAQARVMQRSCVECHNTHPQSPRKDWQEGDVRGVLEIIRPLDKDEARVGEALRLALLLSAVVSGLLLGGSMLVVWAGRRRSQPGRESRTSATLTAGAVSAGSAVLACALYSSTASSEWLEPDWLRLVRGRHELFGAGDCVGASRRRRSRRVRRCRPGRHGAGRRKTRPRCRTRPTGLPRLRSNTVPGWRR